MSEMIERVANALVNGTLSQLGAEDQAYWRGRARVAVETMREPTEEMVDAGLDVHKRSGRLVSQAMPRGTYRAMIYRALSA